MKPTLLLLVLCLLGSVSLFGQNDLPANPPPPGVEVPVSVPAPPATEVDMPGNRPVFNENVAPTHTDVEVWLSVGVLAFGALITLALLFFMSQRMKSSTNNEFIDALRYPIVLVIIVASIFLVTAGYDTSQMAPILGLLGTIAGYLMGRGKTSA